MASTTTMSPPSRRSGLDVVGEADILRCMVGVPEQLLCEGMFWIEMEIAIQSFVGADCDVANHADTVLIVSRSGGSAFGMIDIDFRALVERDGLIDGLGQIGSAVLGSHSQDLYAAG